MDDFTKTFARPSAQQLCSFARNGLDLSSIGLKVDERSYEQQLREDERPIKQQLKDLLLDVDAEKYEQAAEQLDIAIESNRNAYFEMGICWGARLMIDILFGNRSIPSTQKQAEG